MMTITRLGRKGFVLVLVLLILAILTAAVTEFAYGVYVNISGLDNMAIMEGLSVQCASLVENTQGLLTRAVSMGYLEPGAPEMEIPFDGGITIYYKMEDESAKFNVASLVYQNGKINEEASRSFKRLLKALGLGERAHDLVVDWIDPDTVQEPGGNENGTKNAPLASTAELGLFLDPAVFDKLEPYVTVFGGGSLNESRININTADVPVLMSLSDEITEEVAKRVLTRRGLEKFTSTAQLQDVAGFKAVYPNISQSITIQPSAYTLKARATRDGITRVLEAVVEEGKVKYWREY